MRNPVHLDLVSLAKDLRTRDEHPDLVKAVDRAAAIGSIREDLRSARASLRLIGETQDRAEEKPDVLPGEDSDTTIAGALFTYAIILYSRATFTSGARPLLLGQSGLTPEERQTHEEVKQMRNTALAHYGRAEAAPEGPIVREAVVRSFDREQFRYGVYVTRAQHRVGIAKRLASLIERRLEQVAERQQDLFNAVELELNAAARSDPKLGPSLPRYQFNPHAFCASPAAAEHMHSMLDAGDVVDMDFTTTVPKP